MSVSHAQSVGPPGSAGAAPVLTVVHTQACHFCDEARTVLDELAREYLMRVEYIDAGSPLAQRLIHAHRPSMYPLVLVDGAFFSHGRLPRRKLRALLDGRAAVSAR